MVDWNELAKQCAKATGFDREIDADLFQLAGGGMWDEAMRMWDEAMRLARRPCGCPDDILMR